MTTAAEITALCQSWLDEATKTPGFKITGAETEKFRLRANGVRFETLDHDALTASAVGLTQVLLTKGLNSTTSLDHYFFWAWCGQLLLHSQSGIFDITTKDLNLWSLYTTAIHASIAGGGPLPKELQHHTEKFVRSRGTSFGVLVFPLLEGLLRRATPTYLAMDGKVLAGFKVNGREYKAKTRCNSVSDALRLFRDTTPSVNLASKMDTLLIHVARIVGKTTAEDGIETIGGWRNAALHGEVSLPTVGGVLLNLCLLISLFEIEADFEKRRESAASLSEWFIEVGAGSHPGRFFPPFD